MLFRDWDCLHAPKAPEAPRSYDDWRDMLERTPVKRWLDASNSMLDYVQDFEEAAAREGYRFAGGKLDDVAVVCGVVRPGAQPAERVRHKVKDLSRGRKLHRLLD